MKGKAFFDTNVLVYAMDTNEPEKAQIAKNLIQQYGETGNLVISTQVLQELYVTLTKSGKIGLSKNEAQLIVNALAEYPLVQVNKELIALAMDRNIGNQYSFWDSLIVEAALQSGCKTLFTEDMHNNATEGSLRLQNPFLI